MLRNTGRFTRLGRPSLSRTRGGCLFLLNSTAWFAWNLKIGRRRKVFPRIAALPAKPCSHLCRASVQVCKDVETPHAQKPRVHSATALQGLGGSAGKSGSARRDSGIYFWVGERCRLLLTA